MTIHLDALNLRLSNERARLAAAKTPEERALRSIWIYQIKKEIGCEEDYLRECPDMSDDELLAALNS